MIRKNSSQQVDCRDRPKFGFGAESRQMATFGHASVSAESQKSTFGFLSVSAENDVGFRPSTEYLFKNVKRVTADRLLAVNCCMLVNQVDKVIHLQQHGHARAYSGSTAA